MLHSVNITKQPYPFGMQIQERQYTNGDNGYRYGFNGMEKDDETKGGGNSLDFGARIYDGRLGRWFSVDPLASFFVFESSFTFVSNNPIIYQDRSGNSKYLTTIQITLDKQGKEVSRTTLRVLVDTETLMVVERSVTNKIPHDTHLEYDYYDVNDVQTTVIKADGSKTTTETLGERGAKRYHTTTFEAKWFANLWMERDADEMEMINKGMVGIRWTTSSSIGGGNQTASGKISLRSENIDMLLGVLKFANSTAREGGKNISKAPKDLDDILKKLKAAKSEVDASKTLKDLNTSINEEQQYNNIGHGCNSCKNVRHDGFDYKDRQGNLMDGKTGDTISKSK